MAKFSLELKRKRAERGLTLRAVERETGGMVTNPMVLLYEKGRHLRFVSFRTVYALSNLFGWNLYEMAAMLEEEGEWKSEKRRS